MKTDWRLSFAATGSSATLVGRRSIGSAIGTLRRFPTQDSLDTLNSIAATSPDKDIQERASSAAEDVGRRLRGEVPQMPQMPPK